MLQKYSVTKVNTVEKAKLLYEQLCNNGYKLSKRMRKPKYYKLLCRVRDGFADMKLCNFYIESTQEKLEGKVGSIFMEHDTPRVVYRVSSLSAPDGHMGQCDFIVIFRAGVATLVFSDGVIKRYNKNHWLFLSLIEKEELPVDLRKWHESWLRIYFQTLFKFQTELQVRNKDILRSTKLFGYTPILDKIHYIRRINPRPTKAQLNKVDSERKEELDLELDPSFSLEH